VSECCLDTGDLDRVMPGGNQSGGPPRGQLVINMHLEVIRLSGYLYETCRVAIRNPVLHSCIPIIKRHDPYRSAYACIEQIITAGRLDIRQQKTLFFIKR